MGAVEVTIYDDPITGVYAETPIGSMYFDRRDDADFELPLMFPGAKISVSRSQPPADDGPADNWGGW